MFNIAMYYVHGCYGNGKKKMFLALREEWIGRRKRELAFPKRLWRFEQRLYCLAVGGEHDEVNDAASVGSVEHQRMKRP